MGFTEVLTIIFVVLKLIDVISWSWWLVLLPEIIALVIYIPIIVIYFVQVHQYRKELKDFMKDWR